MLKIQFKETADSTELNKELKKQNLNTIVDMDYLNEWVEIIKKEPKDLEYHLGFLNEGEEFDVDKLKMIYPTFTVENELAVDFYFGRIEQKEATKYGDFILKHKKDIEYIQDGIEFTNRFDFSDEVKETILELNRPYEEPEKLPEEEQYIPNLQSGILLAKTFSVDPVWIIYGNVDKPTYLKERVFIDNSYNKIYKDEKGYAYLLVPLAPMDITYNDFINKVYDDAFELGIRESHAYFTAIVYNAIYAINDLVNLIEESFTEKEIVEKHNHISNHFNYQLNLKEISWNDKEKKFKSVYSNAEMGKLNLYSALERVIRKKHK